MINVCSVRVCMCFLFFSQGDETELAKKVATWKWYNKELEVKQRGKEGGREGGREQKR